MKPSSRLKPHQSAILLATVFAVVIYAIPPLNWVVLPLTYLNTHIHELCHALVAQATGGTPEYIAVFANGSGVTPVLGSILPLTAMAGYVGASLVGVGLIFAARTEDGARTVLRALAIVMAIGMLIWVRGDLVGIITGIAWTLALFGLSGYLKGANLLFAAQFIGVMQCANSVQSLFTLLQISAVTEVHSDAKLMETVTGVPALFWAGTWCVLSGYLLITGLRRAWSDSLPRRSPRKS